MFRLRQIRLHSLCRHICLTADGKCRKIRDMITLRYLYLCLRQIMFVYDVIYIYISNRHSLNRSIKVLIMPSLFSLSVLSLLQATAENPLQRSTIAVSISFIIQHHGISDWTRPGGWPSFDLRHWTVGANVRRQPKVNFQASITFYTRPTIQDMIGLIIISGETLVFTLVCNICTTKSRSRATRPDVIQVSYTIDFAWTMEPAEYTNSASSRRVFGGFYRLSKIHRLIKRVIYIFSITFRLVLLKHTWLGDIYNVILTIIDGTGTTSLTVIRLNATRSNMGPEWKTKCLFSLRPHVWRMVKFPDLLKAPDDRPHQ